MTDQDSAEIEVLPGDNEKVSKAADLAVPKDILPSALYLLPLRERPFFPSQALPLLLNESPWLETIQEIEKTAHKMAGLILTKAEAADQPRREDFFEVGSVVRVHHPAREEKKIQFIAEGMARFRIVKWLSTQPPYLAQVEYPKEPERTNGDEELRAYALAVINTIKELIPLNPLYSEELKYFFSRFSPNEPSPLVDFAASLTSASTEELQEVLEIIDLRRRMKKVLVMLKQELEVAKLQAKIHRQVEEKITEQQRRFFLREQLKAIQKELGIAKDDRTADIERFRSRLDGLTIPEQAQSRIDEELDKLAMLETGSPEYAVTRNYLDWMTVLPWGVYSKDKLNLKRARRILDEDHDGLDDVKQRIVEFLAVGALKGEIAGSILLLVGPPGVGKTSVGRSIARTLGRRFYRFSVGGMRDEAEIKGHRRTYVGAMPGKFLQAIKECTVANPVIMLDEIDKIGTSYQGDPASALLEVLDPEQNSDFLDHYLDSRFDLSKVLFVCTANQLDTIPRPLLDRMEVIRLGGYIAEEKVDIAKHHLWPKQLEKVGLKPSQIKLSDAALRHLIEGYAREAGVRNLDKQLGRIVRKGVVRLVNGKTKRINVSVKTLEEFLGKPVFQKERPISGVGVVAGLAWTALGGVMLAVEASRIKTTRPGFKYTGQLGSVMKESAEIAYSYLAANLKSFGGDDDVFSGSTVHLHVPEGATPKDGPSAGITMASALLSLARKRKIPRPLAMTGELTLTGHVLPVGGIREKIIAARRGKIMEVILPAANKREFDELPAHIREGMTPHFVGRYQDVVDIVFG